MLNRRINAFSTFWLSSETQAETLQCYFRGCKYEQNIFDFSLVEKPNNQISYLIKKI